MFSCYIKQIKIENIRNFHEITIDFNNKSTIIIGRNGIGKTSILEAISLIYPGNGIRNEKYENIANNQSNQHNWKTIITINDGDYSNIIEAIYQNKKKTIKINDKKIKNFNEILDYCRMFFVTQDDYHQILSSSIFRRRFFDRMIAQFTRDYYNQLVQYNHYIVEKNKIFASHNGYFSASQNSWLDEIDKKLAKLNWLIALNRNDFIEKFNNINNNIINTHNNFCPTIQISGEVEKLQSEIEIFNELKKNRTFLKKNFGIHVSKFDIFNHEKPIHLLSSGEQRLILNTTIICFIKMQIEHNKTQPILLLDDILTFFDKKNQEFLINEIKKLGVQFFITTNHIDFANSEDIRILDLEKIMIK